MTGDPQETWWDTMAGVAGDMPLGALPDAGTELPAVRAVADAPVVDAVPARCPVLRWSRSQKEVSLG